MSGFGHLFGRQAQAQAYAAFRPSYPADLYEHIYTFADLKCYDLAVDIATGSGQAASVLAKRFTKVIAQDQSEAQLQSTSTEESNIERQPARAEETGLPDKCADLVTTAQAMHWAAFSALILITNALQIHLPLFELPAFYREVRRILKPSGAFAAWGYDLCEFPDNEQANTVLHHLYNGVLGPYWSDRRRLVEGQYKGMEPGPEHFGTVERLVLDTMSTEMSVSALVGYLTSWSAHSTYVQRHPDRPDPLEQFRKDYKKAFGFTSDDEKARVTWPLFVILAKESQPV